VTGIRNITSTDFHYAHRLNSTIRLVASAERVAGVHIAVQPWGPHECAGQTAGATQCHLCAGEELAHSHGRGAGDGATGTAVSDVLRLPGGWPRSGGKQSSAGFDRAEPLRRYQAHPVSWFLRLTVNDQPGILAVPPRHCARRNIDSVVRAAHAQTGSHL
jgi:hypothetical protein